MTTDTHHNCRLPIQGVSHKPPGVDKDGALYPGHRDQLLLRQPAPLLRERTSLVGSLDPIMILIGLKMKTFFIISLWFSSL